MTEYFVGRQEELDAFKHCFESKSQNGIYYYGPGGIGKTVLLKKITAFCGEELNYQAVFIDFFSTKNRSIEGLQNTIIERLNTPQAFQEIFETHKKLEEVRTGPAFSYQKELISSLQKQIEVTFSRCCNEAAKNKSIVLIFDSFEYVQRRNIGRWFLNDFLSTLKTDGKHGIIVVLAGRPEPKIASTPENIIQYQLPGLSKDEVKAYIKRIGLQWVEDFEALFAGTEGNPLLIELLRWRGRRELMTDQQRLQKIAGNPEVMGDEIFGELRKPTPVNRVLWAMATFKRRFDFDMLQYLVENMRWLRDADYEDLRNQLRELPFVKSDVDVSSHLLHDAVVEPISMIFKGVDGFAELEDDLFREIVHEYYPERIEHAHSQNEHMHLKAEQLGYILDQDLDVGIAKYKTYLKEIRKQSDYDFEELLWGEFIEHVKGQPQESIDFMFERARWLFENGLYRRLKMLSRSIFDMQDISLENRLTGSQYLGFALMQQGKLNEAERQFQESLKMAKQLQSERHIIEIENNFGQLAALAGKYDKAAEHYWKSITMYSDRSDRQTLGSTYSAYGFVLAMQGHYRRALRHCQYALKIFEKYPNIRDQIRAFINIGIVYRLSGDYDAARTYFIKARELAEKEKFIELEADISRELAHNSYLRGCRAREEADNFNVDCSDQGQALSELMISLDKARKIVNRMQISKSLLLLASVFEEIVRLETLKAESAEFPSLLVEELIEEARNIRIVEDVYWLQHGIEHFPDKTFAELTLLQKVVRLLEIAALSAIAANQSHIAIETQTELTRLLIELKVWEDIEKRIAHIKQTRTDVYDDKALTALAMLLQADVAFDRGDLDSALSSYAWAIPEIISKRGIITNLRAIRRGELWKRINSIENKETALEWCRVLQESWLDAGLNTSSPFIIEDIQILSHELLEEISS